MCFIGGSSKPFWRASTLYPIPFFPSSQFPLFYSSLHYCLHLFNPTLSHPNPFTLSLLSSPSFPYPTLNTYRTVWWGSAVSSLAVKRMEADFMHETAKSPILLNIWKVLACKFTLPFIYIHPFSNVLFQISNARFYRFPVGQISQYLNTTRRSMNPFGTEFWIFSKRGRFSQIRTKNLLFSTSCDFRPP